MAKLNCTSEREKLVHIDGENEEEMDSRDKEEENLILLLANV